jgi:nicotinamidase-related amidase
MHNNTALLVMDMQAAMLPMIPDHATVTSQVAKAIAHARSKGIPVIYVVVGFRPGFPEISANNKGFTQAKQMFAQVDMADFIKVHPDLAPQENECVIVKRRVSGFAGSDLEVVLRAYGIQHMVLTGIVTSGVVLSTLREAADKDFRITVLSDGCADREEDVHQFLTTRIFPRQGDVITVDEWRQH